MALAFHILAHRLLSQVERLCRVLQHPDDVFGVIAESVPNRTVSGIEESGAGGAKRDRSPIHDSNVQMTLRSILLASLPFVGCHLQTLGHDFRRFVIRRD